MEIKEPKKIEHLDRMETMLTELTLHDTMDGETFERYVFPLIEEVRLLKDVLKIEKRIKEGEQT